ncbi:MAG: hypothetical protein WAM14_12085, partial [Candidatus Nitrosopolaris sp.]
PGLPASTSQLNSAIRQPRTIFLTDLNRSRFDHHSLSAIYGAIAERPILKLVFLEIDTPGVY